MDKHASGLYVCDTALLHLDSYVSLSAIYKAIFLQNFHLHFALKIL